MDEIIEVDVEPNWLPPYRLEYDGKYVTLFGGDTSYGPMLVYGGADGEEFYDEMVLVGCVLERRRIWPTIERYDDKKIYIKLSKNED